MLLLANIDEKKIIFLERKNWFKYDEVVDLSMNQTHIKKNIKKKVWNKLPYIYIVLFSNLPLKLSLL